MMATGADLQTDGSGAATTESVTPTVKPATTTAGDTAGKDAEARIAGLTAEMGRKLGAKDTQIATLTTKLEEVIEAHKSDDDKRIDVLVQAAVQAQYGDKLQRVDALEASVGKLADDALASLPEDAKGFIDTTAPAEVRLQQAMTAKNVLANMTTKPTTGTGPPANPAGPGVRRTITQVEFATWQEMASSADPARRQQYKDMRDDMQAARRANLIVG